MSHPLNRPQAEDLLRFAHRLADAAAAVTLRYFRTGIAVVNKHAAGFDPVTEADRGAEAAIRELIHEYHPTHGILGEEHGVKNGTVPLTWVLDPIDGTRAFITGSPMWGTLIALNDGTRPVIGILDQPFLKERFWGVDIPGWRAAGVIAPGLQRELVTRPCARLEDAVISSTTPEIFKTGPEREAFRALTKRARLTRYGGDCYGYGLVALGFMDMVVEASLQPYDIQALIPIIEGAGGRVTTWSGGNAAGGGQVIAAGDPRAHAAALAVVQDVIKRG